MLGLKKLAFMLAPVFGIGLLIYQLSSPASVSSSLGPVVQTEAQVDPDSRSTQEEIPQVPEVSTILLLAVGFTGLAGLLRKKRN